MSRQKRWRGGGDEEEAIPHIVASSPFPNFHYGITPYLGSREETSSKTR
jgi:hypothetical protein